MPGVPECVVWVFKAKLEDRNRTFSSPLTMAWSMEANCGLGFLTIHRNVHVAQLMELMYNVRPQAWQSSEEQKVTFVHLSQMKAKRTPVTYSC